MKTTMGSGHHLSSECTNAATSVPHSESDANFFFLVDSNIEPSEEGNSGNVVTA